MSNTENKKRKKLLDRMLDGFNNMFTVKKTSKYYDIFDRNPVLQIFTEGYMEETRLYEFQKAYIHNVKLNSAEYDIDASVRRLIESGEEFDFHISIPFGSYDNNEQILESSEHGSLTKRRG